MIKRMTALLVLCVLALCLVFATACQGGSAKIKELSLGEGLPTITFDCDYVKATENQTVPALEGWTTAETYTAADTAEKVGPCIISTFDNPQSQSLEEITQTIGKNNNICWDMLEFEDTPCGYLTDFSLEDNKYYRTWIFADKDAFKAVTFSVASKEIQIGNSSYYLRVPESYEQTEDDATKEGVFGTYEDTRGYLVQFTIKKPEASSRSYEEAVERHSENDVEYTITREQYETFAQNGWKAKDRRDYFDLKRGIVDEKIFTVPQTDTTVYAFEYYAEDDGVKVAKVVVALDTDDGEYEIVFKKVEPEDWTSQGGAFAKSIYKKN